ncbi:hypothetical protein [Pseudomonas aeruginosa]|uniref:hypothetical protein n=1 Tax=Pseudomonas aeruginosa TaxID=287 RepID=UPI001D118DA4
MADSQAQVEAAEQAMRRSENKAVQLYAKRVLTEQQEFDTSCAPWPGKRPWRCLAAPDRTAGRAPGGFDERGFLDAQIRQQDRLVARFEGIARDSAILTCALRRRMAGALLPPPRTGRPVA